MRDEIERYRGAGVTPFGINPAAPADHAAYAASLRLPFLLLSDPGLVVARRWQALIPTGEEIDRTVYLVDQDGTIRFSARGMPGADISLEGLEPR